MRAIGRRAALALPLAVMAIVWIGFAELHTGYCPEETPAGAELPVLAVLLLAAGFAGLIGGRKGFGWNLTRALAASVGLAVWALLLLGRTRYLEPLPWAAGWIGVSTLTVLAVGAGLVSGWQWWTLLLLPAAGIGFFHLSESLFDSGVECSPYHAAVGYGLALVPAAITGGALLERTFRRGGAQPRVMVLGESALMLLPLIVFAWAGYRHVRPIDHHPKHPPVIGEGESVVGIGDSLALVRERIPSAACIIPLGRFDPGCEVQVPGRGLIWVEGDPIESIGRE